MKNASFATLSKCYSHWGEFCEKMRAALWLPSIDILYKYRLLSLFRDKLTEFFTSFRVSFLQTNSGFEVHTHNLGSR